MLSIENPPPRDTPCPTSQISQLKNSTNSSGSDDDDKAASDKLHLVDLFKSDHPLPKFSIRDYVFSTRSKDIENNWPFSEDKLQLCLKHGVKDLLPPFQTPDTVRKPSLGSCCSSDTILSEKGNISNSKEIKNDHGVFVGGSDSTAGCYPNIAADCLDTNPCGSEGDKEFPSTITSQTCSEINSVPTNKCPEFETDILPELSPAAKREVANIPAAASRSQAQFKKCRLVVKLGNSANLSTKEDTSGNNNFMVSEAMASKVCPVCKTFSSSSNTTLNAHIDQCLSGESTTKWSSNSKVIKHKIKPRKIKSMIEIYATALHCTLEELDRRNGTNWATNSNFPAQELENAADEKKRGGSSPANLEETPDDEGAVYIDANGTKVRILSKSSDPSLLSKAMDGPPPLKKLVNREKVSKFLLPKKKKQNLVQKRPHKLMKHGKKISTSRPHRISSEINDNQDSNFSGEESFEEEEACAIQPFKAQDEVKFGRSDVIRGWVCSKRTELAKKSNGKDDNQLSGNCDIRDLSVENNRFSLGNSRVKNSRGRRTTNTCENSLSSPGSSKQTDKSSYEPHSDENMELPSVRKRSKIASVESQVSLDRGRSQVVLGFPDHNIKHLRKDKHPNREDCVSVLKKRKVHMYACQDRNVDHREITRKNSSGHNTHSTKDGMSSSVRNKASSGRASVPDPKLKLKGKYAAFRKSGVHCLSESNEEAVAPLDREHLKQNDGYDHDRTARTSDTVSVGRTRTRVLKTRSGGESMISREEESRALKASQSVSTSYPDDAEDNDGSFMLGSVSGSRSDNVESAGKSIHTSEEDLDMEPPSEDAMGEAFMGFRNSMDAQFHRLASSSNGHCDLERFSEIYKETPHFEDEAPSCSAEPILNDGQEMFCAAAVPENMDVVAELGSSDMHGNYFVEVDPIPIPGPPGSFLPSPGHMDSEDLPGNSSLTSSRIQSSDDRQELVDQSSDSPDSALSTISNSTLARSDSKSSEMLLVGCPLPDGFVSAVNGNSFVENSSPALVDTNANAERSILDKLKINLANNEKVVMRFKDQPCCCSRKEGFSQSISLNYQESPLLRRRTMPAAVVPATGKEMTCGTDRRLDSIRSEMSSVTGGSPGDDAGFKSPMGHIQRIAADSHLKFPSRDGCEPNSPPTPNPVLRLMGKNLMVVNNDESVSSQIRPSQLSSIIGHANPHVLPVAGVSVINAQNENLRMACHVVSQAPYSLERAEQSNTVMQRSEWSDGYSSHENARTSQMPPLVSPAMLSSRGAVGGSVGSLMHHEYIPGYNLPTEQHQPLNRMGASANTDADELVRSPSLKWRNAAANTTVNAVKEIIVIDDAPENELDLTPVPAHNQGMMMQGMGSLSSAGKSVAMTSASGSRRASNFYGYPTQYDSAAYRGQPVDASFWMPSNNFVNGSSAGKWNWVAEGSSAVLHPSPLTTTSSSAAQLRPKFYTYSNFK